MDLYFVRHGETVPNAAHRYQRPSEPLSDKGSREIAWLVHHIEKLKPTKLYTSHFKRARQTADFLSYATDTPAERIDFVHELYRPESLYGKSHFGLASMWYITAWFFGWLKNPDDSRVETRAEFFERILAARALFESYDQEDRIVVVSHSVFINFFVAHACQDTPMHFWQAVPRLLKVLRAENTGVTHLRYHAEATSTCRWEVVSFNADDHLNGAQ